MCIAVRAGRPSATSFAGSRVVIAASHIVEDIMKKYRNRGAAGVQVFDLPDPLHAVAVEGSVAADDRELLDQGLRDDQAVERIPVVKRHSCNMANMACFDRQQANAVLK